MNIEIGNENSKSKTANRNEFRFKLSTKKKELSTIEFIIYVIGLVFLLSMIVHY